MDPSFSQRIGKTPIRTDLQRDGMSKELRDRIWNCFQIMFVDDRENVEDAVFVHFFKRMWHNSFKRPVDEVDERRPSKAVAVVRAWFLEKAEWHGIYEFVEYLAKEPEDARGAYRSERGHLGSPSRFVEMCNNILEQEMSAYRIVGGQVVGITDEQELKAVEEAVCQKGAWSTPAKHLQTASAFLFDRKNADYPNAVKEAISAVESACCVVTGDPTASLGQALKEIEKKHPLHRALKEAFTNLYGYTSDAGGIRHGSIDMAKVTFEVAKYMFVACSAFVNYLKGISSP